MTERGMKPAADMAPMVARNSRRLRGLSVIVLRVRVSAFARRDA